MYVVLAFSTIALSLSYLVRSSFHSPTSFCNSPWHIAKYVLWTFLNLNKDIKLIKANRGGKITYHGPGQLICYFVIDLKKYDSIIPCGITDKGITNLKEIKNQSYRKLEDIVIAKFIKNLET